MDQFDNWQEYWENFLQHKYGKNEVATEEDLFCQVGRTVYKKPIKKEVFDEMIAKIMEDMRFSPGDILVELCCGNGLFTYELSQYVRQILAVDFSQNIIDAANKYRSAENIMYHAGSAIDYLLDFKSNFPGIIPGKYLMNDALAYFTPADLEKMLIDINVISPSFLFLIRGVPNEDLKWNYYNTEERKAVYFANLAKGDLTNDGLGNWWLPEDIRTICTALNLKCQIRNQSLPISDYRMDVIITK